MLLSTYYVAPGGSDGAAGTSDGAAWATLQRAANAVGPGDTVIVRAGTYAGFNLTSSNDGTAAQRVTFKADPGVVIDRANGVTSDGINLEFASYVTVEGFTVRGMSRIGIRSTHGTAVVIRNNVAESNTSINIFSSYSTDLLLEGNVARNSTGSHGIYVSNSAERPTVRGNRIYGNAGNGLHFNGDASAGGPGDDGMVDHALVDGNIIYENGAVRGGSAINCDGLRDSVIRNNLVYNNYAAAIKLYAQDAAGPSSGNRIENNTVVIPASITGRWCIDVRDECDNTVIRNNVLAYLNTSEEVGGAINVWDSSIEGLVSDHNVVPARPSLRLDGIAYAETLAEWQERGYDAHSVAVANMSAVFADLANNDFRLKAGSPAVNAGMAIAGITTDVAGSSRPAGGTFDIGAYEYYNPAWVNLNLSSATYSVAEAGGVLTITVTRSGDTGGACSVAYATASGSATSGFDFTAASGTLSFLPGETSKTFTITIADDGGAEGAEAFTVALSSPSGAFLDSITSATVTIADDDNPGQPGSNGLANDLAYDADGRLHFVYYDSVAMVLKYATRSPGGTWSAVQTVDSAAFAGQYLSLAIDPDGYAGVAYYDANNADLRYAHFNGSTWDVEEVDTFRSVGMYPSLQYDAAGRPVVAYYHKTYQDLRIASQRGGVWTIASVDAAGDVGRYASLALNPASGRWAIGYDDTGNGTPRYAGQTKSGWALFAVDADTTGGSGFVSLAFDHGDLPALSYYDAANANLKLARFDGTVWSSQTIASKGSVGLYTELSFDAETGDPDILYFSKTSNGVFRAHASGRTWNYTLIASGGGRWLSSARSADGHLTVGWLGGTTVNVTDN